MKSVQMENTIQPSKMGKKSRSKVSQQKLVMSVLSLKTELLMNAIIHQNTQHRSIRMTH